MPELRGFSDASQPSNSAYDFELRGGEQRWDGTWARITLFERTDEVVTLKQHHRDGFPFEFLWPGAELVVGGGFIRQTIEHGDSHITYLRLVEILRPITGEPPVSLQVCASKAKMLQSGAGIQLRAWRLGATYGIYDPTDHCIVSGHLPWRDSEIARRLAMGFRMSEAVLHDYRHLMAIAASLLIDVPFDILRD